MYSPVFRVSDEALSLVAEICTLLPMRNTEHKPVNWDTGTLCRRHAAMGGQGAFRTSGSRPHWVPVLTNALLRWLQSADIHPLIKSAVFHYELMGIRPFETGNGPLSTQLQRELLADFHPHIAGLEPSVSAHDYEHALAATDASEFITLSLRAILAALRSKAAPAARSRGQRRLTPAEQLLVWLRRHPGSKRSELLDALPSLSARMLDRHLQALKDEGRIEYRGSRKTGAYYAL